MSVCRLTAAYARSITLLRFVVLSPTSADAVKIASQPQPKPSISCIPPLPVPSRLCDDKTNVELMWRYDCRHLRADCNRAAFATSAAQAQYMALTLLPWSRDESNRAPFSYELDMFKLLRFPLLIKLLKPRSPLLRPSRTTVNCDPRSQSRRP